MACPVEPKLSTTDAARNTRTIETILNGNAAFPPMGHVRIPPGDWPVNPITMAVSGSRISGCGVGISKLILELDNPTSADDQHVVASIEKPDGQYVDDITINDISISGNRDNINWNGVTDEGRAFGIWARNCRRSFFYNLEIFDCFTDGVMVSIDFDPGTTPTNNSEDCVFDNAIIRTCGRQGVSVVGGKHLTFTNFLVEDIGQTIEFGKSPRAALDIEPGQGLQRVTNVIAKNWIIRRCGQGVLAKGTDRVVNPTQNVVLSDISCSELTSTPSSIDQIGRRRNCYQFLRQRDDR